MFENLFSEDNCINFLTILLVLIVILLVIRVIFYDKMRENYERLPRSRNGINMRNRVIKRKAQKKNMKQHKKNIKRDVDLNLDFEKGNLDEWTVSGTAFNNQPTYLDNPTLRGRNEPANQMGNYWIGTYENRHTTYDNAGAVQGDNPQGKITSPEFIITKNKMSFLIGGGNDINTVYVELVVDDQSVKKATGMNNETMNRVVWDISKYKGKKAYINVVDFSSGAWGHINFDDVKFF